MSVIEEVKDFADDVKKGIGDKGFYILIAAVGAFGLYNLLKDNNSSEYVSATGYASYPDVGENSEVVIDSISNEIWASHDEVVGAIETTESEVIQNMDDHFEETNGYIQEGLAAQQEIIQKIEEPIQGDTVYGYFDHPSGGVFVQTDTLSEAFAKANGQQKVVESKTVQIKGTPNKTSSTSKKTSSTSKKNSSKTSTATKSNTTSTKAKTSTKKTTSVTSPSTYNYTTKKGLKTSTSIVDALKATGADSSMSARKDIAEANGIKNYSGTAAQNTKMLNMMKSGDLVKPTSTKSSSSKSSSSKSSSKKK